MRASAIKRALREGEATARNYFRAYATAFPLRDIRASSKGETSFYEAIAIALTYARKHRPRMSSVILSHLRVASHTLAEAWGKQPGERKLPITN